MTQFTYQQVFELADQLNIPKTERVYAACQCARAVLHLVPEGEERPRLAIEAAEKWCKEPTDENAAAAAAATAYAVAANAAAATAYAAAATAYAVAANAYAVAANASYANAAYAAYAAAYAAYAAAYAAYAAYAAKAANQSIDIMAILLRHMPKVERAMRMKAFL